VKSAFIQNIARNLRSSYSNFQESFAAFPIDSLSETTRQSFDKLIESVDFWLERGVFTAEVGALNYLWMANPNTGIRGPKTPSEEHLQRSLRITLDFLIENIRAADAECLEPFVPLIVPSFQPYVDAVVAAASDQIPKINEKSFSNSLISETESVQATADFIAVLNRCGSATSTDTCIQDFVSVVRDCSQRMSAFV
jgi:hypothetical protein